jgi:hypothetical protein
MLALSLRSGTLNLHKFNQWRVTDLMTPARRRCFWMTCPSTICFFSFSFEGLFALNKYPRSVRVADVHGVPWVLHEAFNDGVWHLTSETKMIISGDPIPINAKNQKPITIKPNAPAFWGTNFPPQFKDSSGAMIIRMLIIKFTKTFDPNAPLIGAAAEAQRRNPALKPQDLILHDERSGLLQRTRTPDVVRAAYRTLAWPILEGIFARNGSRISLLNISANGTARRYSSCPN